MSCRAFEPTSHQPYRVSIPSSNRNSIFGDFHWNTRTNRPNRKIEEVEPTPPEIQKEILILRTDS